MLEILDLSGYSFSGKSAVYDYLENYINFYTHGREFEFELLRIRGGIHDLKYALTTKNWSFIRSAENIRAFKRIIDNLSKKRNLLNRLNSIGSYYEDYFPGFYKNANLYINELINFSYKTEWPFDQYEKVGFLKSENKFKKFLNLSINDEVFLSRIKEEEFDEITKRFFDNLFKFINDKDEYTHLILNNAFEPFYPESSLNFFSKSKSIIIDRDPRDVYISAKLSSKINGINVSNMVLGNSTEDFIKRFSMFHQNLNITNPSILRINFENFILSHKKSLVQIKDFLNCNFIPSSTKSIFDLKRSSKNIYLWKKQENYKYLKEIEKIESELSNFCYL